MPLKAFFSGPGLDRADAARADPARLREFARSPAAKELVWSDGLPAMAEDGSLKWRELSQPGLFLGLQQDSPHFSPLPDTIASGPGAFMLAATLNASDAPIFAAALSLARWHSAHRFCARCGSESEIVRGGWSRRCPDCSAEHFPRVDPVVIMLAEHDGKILLGRQPHYPPARYSALAGFVEVGETIEDAVARELYEEAGIHVTDVAYVASQPWPFPSSLMVGCTARSPSDKLTVDHGELDDARWFTRDEVAAAVAEQPDSSFQAPPRHAIARTLLEHWLAS